MDGTHLTKKYFDILLVACEYDAPNHVFPIAFAIVESENQDSWSWFLVQMKDEMLHIEWDNDS